MKLIFISLATLLIAACSLGSKEKKEVAETGIDDTQITGIYSFGLGAEKGRTGAIVIFPNNDNSFLFGMELSVGPPSYNSGSLFDTLRMDGSSRTAFYKGKNNYGGRGCKWEVTFHGDSLTIKTLEGADECGLGNGVSADGTYRLLDRTLPTFYTNQQGDTIYRRDDRP
ncbi:hypothetical protein JHJ32_07525 [Parapedobacter sp. ISTM3]|uniref:hypothetical protein n=1 Tax=Parapedobacter sp. ISTM3 TaxID=2800130 RepID=UPI001906BD6C|nr:hypothetical protein [Parapedobacter sp. ISTM3]MBK1439828.1 hypothetical protein [Parapedobacter sp. ISTM3]